MLGRRGHGAAVVGAVGEEALDQGRVAGDEPGAQPRGVRALGQAMEDQAALEAVIAHGGRRLEQARGWRRLVRIELRIALVGGDHEVVPPGELDQARQGRDVQHRPGRVARGAEIEELAAPPGGVVHRVEIGLVASLRQTGQIARRGPGEEGRPLVDLIEGVGHQDQGVPGRVHDRLGEGEEGLPRAVHGENLAFRVDPRVPKSESAPEPAGDRLPQGRQAPGAGVCGQGVQMGDQGLGDEAGRGMAGLTDGQGDGVQVGGRRDTLQQGGELLERVGLKSLEGRVHG